VQFDDLGVTVANGGLGKVQFATQTQHLLDGFQAGTWLSVLARPGHWWTNYLLATLSLQRKPLNTTSVASLENRYFPGLKARRRP